MFDSVVDLLASLSPTVAALNRDVVDVLRAESGRRSGGSEQQRRVAAAGIESGATEDGAMPVVGVGATGLEDIRRLLEIWTGRRSTRTVP